MNCKAIEAKLSAFVDGELTGVEMLEIRRHLACCKPCCEEERELRALKSILTLAPAIEPSAEFEAKLADRLREAPAVQERRSVRFFGFAALCAAAALFAYAMIPAQPRARAEQNHGRSVARSVEQTEIRSEQQFARAGDPLSGGQVIFASDTSSR